MNVAIFTRLYLSSRAAAGASVIDMFFQLGAKPQPNLIQRNEIDEEQAMLHVCRRGTQHRMLRRST